MGLFHRRSKQLKTRQDLQEWWERQTTDDAPRTATDQKTTTTSPDKATESRLHDEGQDGNDADRSNEDQSDKTHTVADTHDGGTGEAVTASDKVTTEDGTSEIVDGTDEATVSHMNDATTATKNVEPAHETDGDEAVTVDGDTRSQTAHGEPDSTETGDVERSTDIPATPVTDAVAGRSDEIPHLKVSTISADEADTASITSMFGAQVSNAAQGTEQPADDEVTES